jgi:hypothetical protein
MSIELDWQIVNEDTDQLEHIAPPSRPRRRWPSRKWLSAIALIAVVCLAAAVTYMAWTYHVHLARVREQVQPIAALEAQAIASNDRDLFLALQDPEDSAWRSMQAQRFARLENVGLPELGWQAMNTCPRVGDITLEPDGARLDVTVSFVSGAAHAGRPNERHGTRAAVLQIHAIGLGARHARARVLGADTCIQRQARGGDLFAARRRSA